mmetsp:Transcript_8720/g.15301  ORF Transcript_8720/g.15301 Transcript_8720/m.15301 type:complete len:185 (+) Transcript_8720:79-633(+)|eukprot:CAMPEP_0184523348 /NCGR_PEP_ID=MMETSP0198_2-20121128/8828_1 /TAXON_ID=1112570 /ORGANISM="Thraustochytrium sp., Strain LLF1b" /LENGTH=184 /DNA_ID=CAMNT_0026914357 /DNA_START=164 /DNA_END=718 /DNA_ORIENTATION=+
MRAGLMAVRRVASLGGARAGLVRSQAVMRPQQVVMQHRWFSEEAPSKEASPEVQKIVDQIVGLNLLQVSELVEELNTKLNLPEMPMGGMMMPAGGAVAPGAAPVEAEEAKEEVKAIVSIQLDSFDAASKIKLIKEVKNLCELGLKEAKAAVEGAPATLLSDVKRSDAEEIVKTLEGVGAKVSLV